MPSTQSHVVVSVFFAEEDIPGVRALLEGIAPDQNLAFLLFETDVEDPTQRDELRTRITGRAAMSVHVTQHGGSIGRSTINFVSGAAFRGVDTQYLCTFEESLADETDQSEQLLAAVTGSLGRRGCVVAFAGALPQMPSRDRMRALLGRHDGLVLLQRHTDEPFLRLAEDRGGDSTIEVLVQLAELSYVLLEHAEPLIAERRPLVVSPRFQSVEQRLPEIIRRVNDVTGHDLASYQPATIVRRTIRRMHLTRRASADSYLELLQTEAQEASRLFDDLLVNVTAFFRDPDAFDALADKVLAGLVRSHSSVPARIWVIGCSTGEEAYSLAMLLDELSDAVPALHRVQIFATDLDETAISAAREGLYPASRVAQMTPERVSRFFTRLGDVFRVRSQVRDRIVFSKHDVINDPPFSRMDLICCRNVMIYFGDAVRERLVSRFHMMLRPGGVLFLGPSESLEGTDDRFSPLDPDHHLYRRTDREISEQRGEGRQPRLNAEELGGDGEVLRVLHDIVAARYTPRAVVVTEDGTIMASSGGLAELLIVPEGTFDNNLLRMMPEGLRSATKRATREALLLNKRVDVPGGQLTLADELRAVTVSAEPLATLSDTARLVLVVFHIDSGALAQSPVGTVATRDGLNGRHDEAVVDRLEYDLAATRSDLQRVAHEAHRVTEELKVANEELMAMNEELQAAIEGLESSQQELQRTNAELAQSNADLANVLASTGIPTLFLDSIGVVRRFNPAATQLFNIRAGDEGRPLAHFTHNVTVMPALPPSAVVYDAPEPIEDEVTTTDGGVYLRRVLPYRTTTGVPNGVVVTFTSVTERVRITKALRESESRLRKVIDGMFAFVGMLDVEGTLIEANSAPLEAAGLTREDVIGRPFWECAWWSYDEQVQDRVRDAYRRASTGETVRFDEQIAVANNNRITIDFMLQPIFEDGQLSFFVPSGVDVTHREAAERRLTAQLQLTEAITENASTAILALNAEGCCEFANPAVGEVMGFSQAELLGQRLHDLMHPHDRRREIGCDGDACPLAFEQLRSVRGIETLIATRAGDLVPVSCSAQALGESEAPEGMVIELHDLREEKQARVELEDSERRFRLLAETIPQLAWISNPDGDVFWYNQNYFDYTASSFNELQGWGWTKYNDPDVLPSVIEKWQTSLATGTPFDMILPILGADGLFRPFLTRINPLRGEDGAIQLWFGTGTDIGDERAQQERLRRSERQLQSLADALPDVVVRFDGACRLVFVNATIERWLGIPPDDALGKGCNELGFETGFARLLEEAITSVFATGVEQHIDSHETAARHPRYLATRLTPEFDDDGTVLFVLALLRDRTTEVLATESLQESSHRKDQFLATLAHELRNPLAPLRNGLEVLRLSQDFPENVSRTHDIMSRQVSNMSRMIDDLLDVSRISLGKLELRLETVDLREVIRNALAVTQDAIDERHHTVAWETPALPMMLTVDAARIEQVVSNLLQNAAKYTPDGGRLQLTAAFEDECAVIQVQDSGIGIEPSDLERVFDPFLQLENTGTMPSGLGIGLALVRQLVELHGGSVEAVSAGRGKGSTFSVCLPRTRDAAIGERSVTAQLETFRTESVRVLVVDDNTDAADSLAELLQLLGHETEAVYTAHGALEILERYAPHVIFIDIGLPDMSGYELAYLLRRRDESSEVILAALTGWGSDEHRRRSEDSGFDYHLTKPAEMELVGRILSRAARSHSS